MKDFDTARATRREQAEFKIGGEIFRLLPVRPEVLIEHQDMSLIPEQMLPQLDALVVALVDPEDDAHARYKALREREVDPLTLGDCKDLMMFLIDWQSGEVEEETGRPTDPPSSSGRGPAKPRTGTRSTAVSPSPAIQAA